MEDIAMQGKMQKRLLSLLLSAILVITGPEMSTVSAAEESVQTEQSVSKQDSEKTQQSEEASSDQKFDNTQSTEESATESEEIFTELQTDTDTNSSESVSESQTEETTAQQTESNSSEQQTEDKSSELQTEVESSEYEQESETLTEDLSSETTEITTEQETGEITTEEETEFITEELQTSDAAEMQFEIYVNPLYKDVIDTEELSQQLNSLQVKSLNSTKSATQSFQTFDAAAAHLRKQMVARETTVSVQVPISVSEANKGAEGFHITLLNAAIAHTEECSGQEGDALKWQYGGSKMSMSSGSNTYTVTYTISYYTTLAQEQELTTKVNNALDKLALSGKTDYQKVKAIHDYICDNTDYDYDNLENDAQKIKFTAYGALCTGKAVCQGYAVAFYRMCKEAGLPVRIITGTGNGGPHAWNIVKIGSNTRTAGSYYNIDCTWDGQDQETHYTYFLLNEKDFVKHTRNTEYNTSEFHTKYPMSETSYVDESSLPTGLNKENPSATFTTINDETVTSTADGKPKILIFFQTACPNSQSTIRAVAGNEFMNVDIYAAEIYGRSKEDVTSFKNTYGNNTITFLYDTKFLYGTNTQIGLDMFQYAKEGGLTDGNSMSVALPMICYIDANNMLQHVTQGKQNASQVEVNLKNYCSAAPVKQYKITYELNGGTNHSENPTVFKENSDTILLKDPTKTGFTFAGWYLDAAMTQKVTQIEHGTASDITLYAKWSSSGASDKLNIDNPSYKFTTIDEDMVFSTTNGKPKILIFFSYVCGKSQQTIKDIATKGVSNVDIFAVENNQATKTQVQSFKNTYGSDAITFLYDESGTYHNQYANNYVDLANKNDFSAPIICYIDANNKFQHITFGTSSASAIRTNLDLYCNGTSTEDPTPTETYTITYELDGGINSTDNPSTYKQTTETITLQTPAKEGYTFAGWYRDAAFTLPITQIVKGSSGNLTLYAKWKSNTQEPDEDKISISSTTIILGENTFSYNGRHHEPNVTIQYENKPLTLDNDYTLSYKNNVNAGTATITITGINNYQGTVEKSFIIQPAKLVITALDKTLLTGSPAPTEYDYRIEGLVDGEKLLETPIFTCNVPDPVTIGKYDIIPSGAKADSNYDTNITYHKGTLEVVKQFTGYTVTFDTRGHGIAPQPYNNVSSGTTIQEPITPSAEGYQFEGWYCESECKTTWNFNTDIIQSDITLFAKWSIVINNESEFRIQEIADVVYTGKACKPAVSVYDGDTLLKLNKDYSIKYTNNIDANSKKGNGIGTYYDPDFPSIIITGKGNYDDEEVHANFTIQKAKIADANGDPAKGITLKYTDQFVTNETKSVNPFGSLKYGKTLTKDTDFELSLAMVNENNEVIQTFSPAEIPAGTFGTFLLTIYGKGNYEGTIKKRIYVADKSKLLKNAKITLGANIKNIEFSNANTEKKVILPAGCKDKETNTYHKVDKNGAIETEEINAKDVFLVTCNGESLIYKKDFDVVYSDNDKVGTASITIIGMGAYVGEKTASFRITGKAFKANTITVKGITDKEYTGSPLTQNTKDLKLSYKEDDTKLSYLSDYTIRYKNNINKGTATITFTAAEGSIYSGSFNKTFKIKAVDINSVLERSENNAVYEIITPYEKSGAKPTDQIRLTYNDIPLQNGKDYTVSYQNNKAIANKNAVTHPTMSIKGKGSFTGKKEIAFTITQGVLKKEHVTITPVAYNDKKADSYQYNPSVKIKVGNTVLKKNTDFKIVFENNDQASYKDYINKQSNSKEPVAVITSGTGNNYAIENTEIRVPLPIYQTKLTKNNVYIVVESAVYTGQQVTPEVRVYFADSDHTEALKEVKNNKLTTDTDIQRAGLTKLVKDVDYTLNYGTNITAGKNKGSVTITGKSNNYGGSITQKFNIQKKTIK